MPVRTHLFAVAALSVLAAACGSDEPAATPVDTAEAVISLVAANGFDLANTPPADLTAIDVTVGTGDEAQADSNISVQYTGVAWSNGELFDSSWSRNMPFTFRLGDGQVIAGWDQGVAGMRVGGQRLLILPPDFAYGDSGVGPIAPGETLIFVVDLVSVG